MNTEKIRGTEYRKLPLIIAMSVSHNAFAKLPATLKSLDGIPEDMHDFYEQIGDDYVLAIDDAPFKSKLQEFRNNNISLLKQKEEMEKSLSALKGVDPEKYKQMQKQLQELEDKKLMDEGDLESLVSVRTERMRKDFESQAKTLSERAAEADAKANEYRSNLEKVLIDSQVSGAVSGVGTVRQGAMMDVQARARSTWKLDENGNPIATNPDGSAKYGKDGNKPLTITEWASDLLQEAPYLFEGSSGGGSSNNDRQRSNGSAGVLQRSDRDAFARNLEKIAKGEIKVTG